MRHGRTDWNQQRRIQGRTDIPLNDEGREMARKAAEEYKDVHFDVCYCSPLIRAKETAQLLLEGRNVPIIFDDRLKEMSFGIYEGVANSFSIPDCPINEFFFHPEAYTTPVEKGESPYRGIPERSGGAGPERRKRYSHSCSRSPQFLHHLPGQKEESLRFLGRRHSQL